MYSPNFWVPFTLWGIGLVAVFFHVYLSLIYELTYVCLDMRLIEVVSSIQFFMFSGFNSNLQYVDTVPSFDWMDCFLLPSRNWISSVGIWSSVWPPLDWISEGSVISFLWICGSEFCVGMLMFLRKIRENIIYVYYSKCLCLQWERFIVTLNLRF